MVIFMKENMHICWKSEKISNLKFKINENKLKSSGISINMNQRFISSEILVRYLKKKYIYIKWKFCISTTQIIQNREEKRKIVKRKEK